MVEKKVWVSLSPLIPGQHTPWVVKHTLTHTAAAVQEGGKGWEGDCGVERGTVDCLDLLCKSHMPMACLTSLTNSLIQHMHTSVHNEKTSTITEKQIIICYLLFVRTGNWTSMLFFVPNEKCTQHWLSCTKSWDQIFFNHIIAYFKLLMMCSRTVFKPQKLFEICVEIWRKIWRQVTHQIASMKSWSNMTHKIFDRLTFLQL